MADSKFLRYQDTNGDGLIDVCEDVIEVKPPFCETKCLPDPGALVPNWRDRSVDEPWF